MSHHLFSRNVLKLGGGTALGQLLAVMTVPLITRLYNPSDMGLLGIFMAFVGFASVGTALRYEMLIVQIRDDQEANCVLTSSLLLTIPVSLFAGLVLYTMISLNLLSYQLLPEWSAVAAVCLLMLTGVFTSLRYWFVRYGQFGVVSRALIYQGLGRGVVPVLFGLAQVGWIGLLVGEITSRALGIGKMALVVWPVIRNSMRSSSLKYYSSVLRRNWKAPAVLLPSSLIDALGAAVPLPIIAYLFSAEAAGQFFLVQRVGSLPAGLIVNSVADVFHSTIADAHRKESAQIRAILLRVTKKLALASFVIYVPIALISPFVFDLVFGKEWYAAGLYMVIFSPLLMVSTVVSPVSRLLVVVDKMELKFIFDIINLIVPFLSFFGAEYLGFEFLFCLGIYVAFQIVTKIIYFNLIWRASAVSISPDKCG